MSRNGSAGFVLPSAGPLAGIIPGDPGNRGRISIWNVLERRVIRRVPPTRLPDHSALLSPDGTTIAAALPVGAKSEDRVAGHADRPVQNPGAHQLFERTEVGLQPRRTAGRRRRSVRRGRRVERRQRSPRGPAGHGRRGHNDRAPRLQPRRKAVGAPRIRRRGDQCINPLTGATLAVLTDHTRLVYQAAYSPNGGYLVTTSDDGTANIYDAARLHAAADDPRPRGNRVRSRLHPKQPRPADLGLK